jgi:sterol carrier protein 2
MSEEYVRKFNLEHQAVEIAGQAMATDLPSTFEKSSIKLVGYDMSRNAAKEAFKQAGVTPQDVQVVELHDCFSANELITYEALGLCAEGQAGKYIQSGQFTYGGKYVVNPSGGLISKGHPLGATGLAQCAELCWQLRQMCGKRQVPNVKFALQHNIGLGGAAVVSVYRLGFPDKFRPFPDSKPNPAVRNDTLQVAATSASASPSPKSAAAPAPAAPAAKGGPVSASAIFGVLSTKIQTDPSLVQKVKGVYHFKLTPAGGQQQSWTVDLKNGAGSVQNSAPATADCTITMAEQDFVDLLTGKINGQQAFSQGKLKIAGNMALAMKLSLLQDKPQAKM